MNSLLRIAWWGKGLILSSDVGIFGWYGGRSCRAEVTWVGELRFGFYVVVSGIAKVDRIR